MTVELEALQLRLCSKATFLRLLRCSVMGTQFKRIEEADKLDGGNLVEPTSFEGCAVTPISIKVHSYSRPVSVKGVILCEREKAVSSKAHFVPEFHSISG